MTDNHALQAVSLVTGNLAHTNRELDVLRLLARELSNRSIARELYISETTVKVPRRQPDVQAAGRRQAEAVYAASRLGLL